MRPSKKYVCATESWKPNRIRAGHLHGWIRLPSRGFPTPLTIWNWHREKNHQNSTVLEILSFINKFHTGNVSLFKYSIYWLYKIFVAYITYIKTSHYWDSFKNVYIKYITFPNYSVCFKYLLNLKFYCIILKKWWICRIELYLSKLIFKEIGLSIYVYR